MKAQQSPSSQTTSLIQALPPLPRDQYGALSTARILNDEQRDQLRALIASAVKARQLPAPFFESTKRELSCMNLDEYDVLLSRRRVKGVIVQSRSFWKDMRKGYTRGSKSYYLVIKAGKKLEVKELEKATCAKRAKNTTALGQLVAHYLGAKPLACKPPVVNVYAAFKVLAHAEDGTLRSVFDDSEYALKKWRSEAAQPEHGGGYYFYWCQQEAEAAVRGNRTFQSAWTEGKQLVLCEVEVSGREVQYDDGKVAASRLRVLKVIRHIERSTPTQRTRA